MIFSASTAIGSRSVNADTFSTSAAAPAGSTIPPTQIPLHGGPHYFAVCDGLGAEEGRTASRRAIEGLQKCWNMFSEQDKQELPLPELALHVALEGKEHLKSCGFATTLSLVLIRGERFAALNVGDSPILLKHADNSVEELSKRDNAYFRKHALGIEANPGEASFLLAELGTASSVHVAEGRLRPREELLICSDGVAGVHDPYWPQDTTAEEIVLVSADDPKADNCTAILIRREGE